MVNEIQSSDAITGVVDLRSQKFYEISEKTLIHLGCKNLNLYKSDFSHTPTTPLPPLVLGLPAPALFPTSLVQFHAEQDEAKNKGRLDDLLGYVVGEGDNRFENVVHYLAGWGEANCLQMLC